MKLIGQITVGILLAGLVGSAVMNANQHREKPGARIDGSWLCRNPSAR